MLSIREVPHITSHFLKNNMTSIGAQLYGQWNNIAGIEVYETLWDLWKFSE